MNLLSHTLRCFLAFFILSSAVGAHAQDAYPTGPDPVMTPGSLCLAPTDYRYPEHIAYCKRNVDTAVKNEIIRTYDKQFGFTIESMNRQDFKIDHLIPLCAGGSNEVTNLWPQYKAVYEKTDPIEPLICQLMSMNRMTQAQAVETILNVKHHLETADDVLKSLRDQIK